MDKGTKDIIVGLIDAAKELTKIVQGLNLRVWELEHSAYAEWLKDRR